jgi:hypothetical protein
VSTRLDFRLALRSRVAIAAPAAAVWPVLGRLDAWKASVVSFERLAGEPDEEGETLRVGQRPADVTVNTILHTLRVERGAWRVQSLITEDGEATDGYVTYTLDPLNDGTLVTCELVARCRVAAPAAPPDVAAFARGINAATLAKLDADHAVLKRLVETGRT